MVDIPKSSAGDFIHALFRSAFGVIPYGSQAAIELFSAVITPPIEKRRNEWMSYVSQSLEEVQQKVEGFSIDALANRPEFITVLLRASQAAIRTHHREKLDALRNAVLHVALEQCPDETQTLMFLSFVDDMTPLHIRVLTMFDKSDEFRMVPEAAQQFVRKYLPELSGSHEIYVQIVRDLERMGLVHTNVTAGTATAFFPFIGAVSDLGKRFLSFVTVDDLDGQAHE